MIQTQNEFPEFILKLTAIKNDQKNEKCWNNLSFTTYSRETCDLDISDQLFQTQLLTQETNKGLKNMCIANSNITNNWDKFLIPLQNNTTTATTENGYGQSLFWTALTLLITLFLLLLSYAISILLQKYNKLKLENEQLQKKNQQLLQQNEELEQTHRSNILKKTSQNSLLAFDQHSLSRGFSDSLRQKSIQYSFHDTINDEQGEEEIFEHLNQQQTPESKDFINFSPPTRERGNSFNNKFTPRMHLIKQGSEITQDKRRKTMFSTPYTGQVKESHSNLIFDQNHTENHDYKHCPSFQVQSTLPKNHEDLILIQDQESDNHQNSQETMKCKRNLFQKGTQNDYLGSSALDCPQRASTETRYQNIPSVGRFQNMLSQAQKQRHDTFESDPYNIMRNNQNINRNRQSSMQKFDRCQSNGFLRLPQSMKQQQAKQTAVSQGREAFNLKKNPFSPNLTYVNQNQQNYNLNENQKNPVFSPQYNHFQKTINLQNAQNSPQLGALKFNQQLPQPAMNMNLHILNNSIESYQLNNMQNKDCTQLLRSGSTPCKYKNQVNELLMQNTCTQEHQYFSEHQSEQDLTDLHHGQQPQYQYDEEFSESDESSEMTYYQGGLEYTAQQVRSPALMPNLQNFDHLQSLRHQQSSSPQVPYLMHQQPLFQNFQLPNLRQDFNNTIQSQNSKERQTVHYSDDLDKENFPCLVYLENGRYRNSFEEICFLGKGWFGVAHKVRHKLDSNFYAIKRIRLHLGFNQDIKEHKVYREIMALPKLNHKNVVRYFGCWAERINQVEQEKIDKRVEKIKNKIVKTQQFLKNKLKNKKENQANDKQMQEVENESQSNEAQEQQSDFFQLKDINYEEELEENFNHKSTNSQEIDAESDESQSYSSNSYKNSKELKVESDNESKYLSELDDDMFSESNQSVDNKSNQDEDEDDLEDSDDDSDDSNMDKFDDDALVELIRKDQQFISIDLMIQMEYCSGQTLKDYLEQRDRKIDRQEIFSYFKQLLSAVKHIHMNGFIHRDLKPANIFIEGNFLKIGDFGLARKFGNNNINKIQQVLSSNQKKFSPKEITRINSIGLHKIVKSISSQSLLTNQIGTSTYLSPEQERNQTYNEKVDIFALGLILCEMCCKFSTLHERITIISDLKNNSKLPDLMMKDYPIESQIILKMISKDALLRPSAQDLLKHPLFEQWSKLFSQNVLSPRELEETQRLTHSQELVNIQDQQPQLLLQQEYEQKSNHSNVEQTVSQQVNKDVVQPTYIEKESDDKIIAEV